MPIELSQIPEFKALQAWVVENADINNNEVFDYLPQEEIGYVIFHISNFWYRIKREEIPVIYQSYLNN
jgi:hypothetical protein